MKQILTLALVLCLASCKKEKVVEHCGTVTNRVVEYGTQGFNVVGARVTVRYEDGSSKTLQISREKWLERPYEVGERYCD